MSDTTEQQARYVDLYTELLLQCLREEPLQAQPVSTEDLNEAMARLAEAINALEGDQQHYRG